MLQFGAGSNSETIDKLAPGFHHLIAALIDNFKADSEAHKLNNDVSF